MKKLFAIILSLPYLAFAAPITNGSALYNPLDEALIVVRDNYKIQQTQDFQNFSHWENLSSTTTTNWRSIAFNGKDTFITVGASKNAVREYSGSGQAYGSWTSFVMPGADGATTYSKVFYYGNDSTNGQSGHFVALTRTPSNIFLSDEQGKVWKKLQSPTTSYIADIAHSKVKGTDYLAALDTDGNLWLSQNNGTNWLRQPIKTSQQCTITKDSSLVEANALGFYFSCEDNNNSVNIDFFNPTNHTTTQMINFHVLENATRLNGIRMIYQPPSGANIDGSLWVATYNDFLEFKQITPEQPTLSLPYGASLHYKTEIPNSINIFKNQAALVYENEIIVYDISSGELTSNLVHTYQLAN